MFVVTLSKASVKKLGVGAMCCALVVFSAMLGRYISTRSVAVAAAGNKIESAQDIQTWFLRATGWTWTARPSPPTR